MDGRFLNSLVLAGALTFSGCATKKFVTKTTSPIKSQVDQVEAKVNQQGQQIDQQRQQIENQSTGLSATNERAVAADQRAGDAINRADAAGQKADTANTKAETANTKAETANTKSDRNARDIGDLRTVIANYDEYKPVKEVAIPFAFDRDVLTADSKQQLDDLVKDKATLKHYFIAVEGFTDKNGSAEYNAGLSRRRADRVVQYLVAQHDIPIYRIHMVGLGAQKPAEDGRTRAANAKNRRVQVTIYTAEQGALSPSASR